MSADSKRPPASRNAYASSRSIVRPATPQNSAERLFTYATNEYGPPNPVAPTDASARPRPKELIASHISALITSRTVRAPARARLTLATTEFSFASSVESSATVSARLGASVAD